MKSESTITIHPETGEKMQALKAFLTAFKIKFEVSETGVYSDEFVNMVKEGDAEYKKGETKSIDTKDLWK